MTHHPPKPPLALCVGIIGHRPNRLPEAARKTVAADIAAALSAIAAAMQKALADYARSSPARRCCRWSTRWPRAPTASLPVRWSRGRTRPTGCSPSLSMSCCLSHGRSSRRISPTRRRARSSARFSAGRGRCSNSPGSRAAEAVAYEAAAYTVVDQSDVVIAVWDGGASGGRGGTTDTLEAAARDGRPLIVVDANGRDAPRLRWQGLDDAAVPTGRVADMPQGDLATGLERLVDALLRPPRAAAKGADGTLHREDEAASLARYLAEDAPRHTLTIGFPLLMALTGVQRLSGGHLRPAAPAVLADREAALAPPAGAEAPPAARPLQLTGAFGWADFVGSLLAQIFRGAFILNFVFGALAVVCAAISIVRHDWKPVLVAIEIGLIVIVVFNTALGLRRQWHRRWFEGRELAERLRVALLLWVVGLRPAAPAGAEPTWTGWYARAVVRAQGLRHARLAGDGLAAATATVSGLIDDQCGYHQTAAKRMHRLEHRLERAGLACFLLTVLVALAYLAVKLPDLAGGEGHGESLAERFGVVVAALTAGLPALATATYGIRVIGDFAGISRRSQRTHEGLAAITRQIAAEAPNLHHLRARVRAAADVMLGDVAGWRLSAESRGLAIPGLTATATGLAGNAAHR